MIALFWILLWFLTGTSCWIRSFLGIPCPGCGSTRAVFALFRGDITKALKFHPLIFISLALIAAYIFISILKIDIFNKSKRKMLNIFLFCVFVLYFGVYITRMILFYPRIEPMTYLETSVSGRLIHLVKHILYKF